MKIEHLEHLGLVVALVDEMGLVDLTDEFLTAHRLNRISPGQVVKAMPLNGLGFVSAPLYPIFRWSLQKLQAIHLASIGSSR